MNIRYSSYIHYWGVKFKEEPITTFCTTILMDCTPDGKPSKNEVYYLLSDCISEDRTLRDELHRARLVRSVEKKWSFHEIGTKFVPPNFSVKELVLSQQAQERSDTNFKRGCIFCRTEFTGLRSDYLKHLSQKHNVQLGKPENLVFIDQLLDRIQRSIERWTKIFVKNIDAW